jgi:hypothetical protein
MDKKGPTSATHFSDLILEPTDWKRWALLMLETVSAQLGVMGPVEGHDVYPECEILTSLCDVSKFGCKERGRRMKG